MARRLPAARLRYKAILLVIDDELEAAKRKLDSSISLDFDRYTEAVDFCNRFCEGGWWQLYDRHVDKIIATNRTHGKKD